MVALNFCESSLSCYVHRAGSELAFAVEAAEKRSKKVRVVSMPCWELFEEQDESYKTSVLPPDVKARVSIEVRHLACLLILMQASGRGLCCCGSLLGVALQCTNIYIAAT